MEQSLVMIPHYIKPSFIYSSSLRTALLEPDLIGYLRAIFNEDINKFYQLRDEMLLRAFEFSVDIRSNYFPSLLFKAQHIIVVNQQQSLYKRFPAGVTGIENLIRRYEVYNDYFFNYISIEAISYMLKKDAEFMKIQFERAGFQLVDIEEVEKFDTNEHDVMPNLAMSSLLTEQVMTDIQVLYEQHPSKQEVVAESPAIEEIFPGRTFLAFQNYCLRKNVKNISQLTVDKVRDFQYEKGVGNKKYMTVKEYYEEYLQSVSLKKVKEQQEEIVKQSFDFTRNFYYFQNNALRRLLEKNGLNYQAFLGNLYEESNISFIDRFQQWKDRIKRLAYEERREGIIQIGQSVGNQIRQHVQYPFFEQFKWNQCAKILNLEHLKLESNDYFFEFITNEEYFESLTIVLTALDAYIPLREKCAVFRKEFSDRTMFILTERNKNQSLEAIGNKVSLTRERVRQIERKNQEKIKRFVERQHLGVIIRHFLADSSQVSIGVLFKLLALDAEDEFFIYTYLKGNTQFVVTDGFIVDAQFKVSLDEMLQMLVAKGQDIYRVDDVVYVFQQIDEYDISLSIISKAMEQINYYRKNDLYIKKTIKLPAMIRYLFKHKIHGPLEMTDENFEWMQGLMQSTFSVQFENGKRAAVARIRDTENVILVKGNTFMYFDLDSVSKDLISEIGKRLEDVLEKDGLTNAMTLYKLYEEIWRNYEISTHFHLYSIIHYFFKDDYDIGQGNTLSIRLIGGERLDAYTLLVRYLEGNGKSTKREISDALKWPNYKVEQTIFRHPQFHQIELEDGTIGVMLFSTYGFTEEELATIHRFYESYMDKDYVFLQDLKFEMEFDDDVTEILAEKGIISLYDFASLIKYIDPDLRGFHQLVCKKGSSYNRIELIIAEEFPTIFTRKELETFYLDKGYALSGLTSLLASLVEEKLFYPYTSYQYINAKLVHLTDAMLVNMKAYLAKVFFEKDYLSALDLTGYSQLPIFGLYDWTIHLIAHLAPNLGYNVIHTTRDYRYNKLLIVPERLGITAYDELVHKVIRDEYEGDYYVQDVANFLVQKKLTHSPVFNNDLKESPLFSINEYGYITLKGE